MMLHIRMLWTLLALVALAGCEGQAFFEALPAADNGQYHIEHPGQPAVLVVHGLTATPWEVLALSLYLAEHNLTVLTPVLAGHARRPVDLEATTWEDWYTSVNESYARLQATSPKVFVVGVSTGGALALRLASERDVAGVVTIGAPVMLRDSGVKYARLGRIVWRYVDRTIAPNEVGHYYPVMPTASVAQLLELIDVTVQDVGSVREPLLIVQSQADATVDPMSADVLYRLAGSDDKRVFWIQDVSHTVIQDDTHGTAMGEILGFIQSH